MTRTSSNLRWRVALGALAVACCLLPAALSQPPAEPADPLPTIKRVPVAPERVGQEMERLGLTALERLPADDFEARLRRARAAARSAPQLVEAHYFGAELSGDALAGKGQWKVLPGGAGPAVLPLKKLTLAVRQPRFDTRDAVLAEFEGQGTGLLVEGQGEQTVNFDWSARQEPAADGVQFQLGLPPCPVASLELDLPPDLVVAADGLPVTGPLAAEKPDLKRWRVTCSNRSEVALTLRRRPGAVEPRVLLAGPLLTRQTLTPDGVEVDFAFDHLKVQAGEFRELTCALDPALRPFDVTAPELEGWSVREPTTPGGPALLTARLREPLMSGSLVVRCAAPLMAVAPKVNPADPQPWTAPGLRLLDAVPGGETLLLRVHPDVSLEGWEPGGFRVVKATGDAEGQTLELVGGLIDGDGKPAAAPKPPGRPSARVRARGTDFRARQVALWKFTDPERPSLVAQITYEVHRGRLFRLPLELPAGYEDIEGITTPPSAPARLRNWETRSERGKTVLYVDLAHPLAPESRLRLTVRLRPPAPRPGLLTWDIPDLVPLGPRVREGGLAIDFDEQRFEGRVTGAAVTSSPPDEPGPWRSGELPDYYGTYRGEPLRGRLELRPLPPRLRVRAASSVVLAPGRTVVETTLQLYAEAGTPQSLDVYMSAPAAGTWKWKTSGEGNEVTAFERLLAPEAAAHLHVLASRNAIGAAALLAASLPGEWRRLTLRRPLKPRESLTLQAVTELARGPNDSWLVPLPAAWGPESGDGEVALYLAGADPVRVEALGLREAQPAAGRGGAAPWRTYRYGAAPVALALRGSPGAGRTAGATIDGAALTTAVEPDGRLVHLLRFQAWGWRDRALPVRLPAGARLRSVQVNGVWVDRLAPVEEDDGTLRVDLPVPAANGSGEAPRRFELVYETDGPRGWLWSRLEVPAPGLPLPPLTFLRRWRLPPGVVPLHDGRLRPLPPAAAQPDEPTREGTDLGALSSLVLRPLALDQWEEPQRQHLVAAAQAVRPAPGHALTLGEALERVACEPSAEHDPLVIDAPALEEAGLAPGTVLAADAAKDAPFWEALGLVHVPCRPAPLLTTRRRLDAWQAAGHGAGAVPPSVVAAVAEAAANGHDTSGRFVWALAWARGGAAVPRNGAGSPAFESLAPGWTEWEPVAGAGGDDLTLVRRAPASAVGGAAAVALAVAFWGLRRRPTRQRLAVLLVWLAAAGSGLLWLPASLHGLAWAPLVAGAAVGLTWYLWSAAASDRRDKGQRTKDPVISSKVQAAALVLCPLSIVIVAEAGGAVPAAAPRATVLVVTEAPDRQVVLAPSDLLKQIDALATAGMPRGAAIAAATYDGKAAGDGAEFEARLLVHSFEDGPVTLPLPFAGVRLQDDGLLDGARAYVTAAPAGRPGFVLKVEKPGPHTLVLRFRVSGTASDSEREVRFQVPRAPQSAATLAVPAGATYFQALVRQGSLTRTEPAPGTTAPRYAVELGRTGDPLVFRWHEAAAVPAAPELRVREAYLWNLSPAAASLSAVLHCTATRGAPTSLALDLPEGLEVQSVASHPAGPGRTAPALKPWRVESTDGKRRLRFEFAAPLSRDAYVVADLVPRRPLAPLATLPLPTPVGVKLAGGFLALRAEGVEAHVNNSGRLRVPYGGAEGAAESREFAQLWQAAGKGDLPALPAPHALQRDPGGEPFLQVTLRVVGPPARGSQEVTWEVGARQAGLRAVARLTAPGNDLLSLVEWEVPLDVVVTRVRDRDGRDTVRRWSRAETRVQAWLDRAPASAEVELEGWKELAPLKDGARFDLPGVRVLSARAATTVVRLIAADGFGLTAEETPTLLPLPDSRASQRELSYRPRGPAYGGRFHVHPVAAGAEAHVLTTAEVVEGQLTFSSFVEYRADGAGHAVEVRLRRWDGEARLDAGDLRRRSEAHGGGEHSWVIDVPPATGPVLLTLSGTMPVPAAGIAFPDVTVTGAARTDRWLAVGGRGLATEGAKQLTALAAVPRAGPDVPAAGRARAERLLADGGTLWKVGGADWALRLLPRRRPDDAAPVRVALTERASAVVDGRHWVHEAVVWLYHDANTDLDVALPEGAHVLGVTVDGLAAAPLRAPADSLRVPLPGATGACCVRLRWAFDPEAEPLDRPRLQRPRLRGAADGPVVWTVHVPADHSASFGPEEGRGRMVPAGAATPDLARAEAQYRLSAALAEAQGPTTAAALALAQRRFYQFCRYAEAGRLLTAGGPGAVSLQGKGFDEWLQDLREKNSSLAREHHFEEVRERAEREAAEAGPLALEPTAPAELPDLAGAGVAPAPGPRGDPLPQRGTPLRWQTGPEGDAPRLLLTSLSDQQTKRAMGATLLLAVLLVLVWALAHFPGALAWVRTFWPEQVALLGCLGWQTYGPALPLLFLIVLGVTARVLFLARRLLALLHRPPSDGSHKGSTASGLTADPRPSAT
jgi:hypothetical protein